jgi:lysophospholipase L1-like esterase
VRRTATFAVSLALALGLIREHSASVRPYQNVNLGAPLNNIAVIGDSYTTGTDEGGQGPRAWTACAWRTLAHDGVEVTPDVASEGRAGYVVHGDHGSVFEDLTARAVRSDDALVVFFGSRNDQEADPSLLADMAHATFELAHRTAPSARLLVIGPPWPTADVPSSVRHIRDILDAEARAVGAVFVDPLANRWFVGRPDLIGADGVHPTDAGHAYLATKIAPLIRAQLPWRA